MKIEINSPNIMTWCDGKYGNVSPQAILDDAIDGKFGDFAGEVSVKRLQEITEDASNFEDDQKQLLAIVGALGMTAKAAVEEMPRWKSLRSQMSLVFGLALTGVARSILVDHAHQEITENDGKRTDNHLDIVFIPDVIESPEITQGFLGKILRTLGYIFVEEKTMEVPHMYNLFGHMAYLYATDSRTLREWAVACQIADVIAEDFISHMSEGTGGLNMDQVHEMLSQLNASVEE